MKYKKLYEQGLGVLEEHKIVDAKIDARLLLEYVCKTNRNDLLAHGDREVDKEKAEEYLHHINKRANHVPLQYITGEQEFMGLRFCVNENTLIPRRDTEILVEVVMRHLHDGLSILDMCTGSGCILLSLLKYSNCCKGVGIDVSKEALEVAKQNAKEFSLEAEFLESDLFAVFSENDQKFDLIVSNPPYIQSEIIDTLMPEVRDFEPRQALDGGGDGLDFYRRIAKDARAYLVRGGKLFFEIGYDEGEAVVKLLEELSYMDVMIKKDFAGLDRVVYGTFLEEKHV